jgi:hypothetical protein
MPLGGTLPTGVSNFRRRIFGRDGLASFTPRVGLSSMPLAAGVRERAERGIEVGLAILNHTVQYNNMGDGTQWEAERQAQAYTQAYT